MILFISMFANGQEQIDDSPTENDDNDKPNGGSSANPADPSENTDAATDSATSSTTPTTSGGSTLFSTKSHVFLILLSLKCFHL